ncbi:MAG: hypothetical protein ACLFQB_08865, partial [Chitinispirillaceae bacterium]
PIILSSLCANRHSQFNLVGLKGEGRHPEMAGPKIFYFSLSYNLNKCLILLGQHPRKGICRMIHKPQRGYLENTSTP